MNINHHKSMLLHTPLFFLHCVHCVPNCGKSPPGAEGPRCDLADDATDDGSGQDDCNVCISSLKTKEEAEFMFLKMDMCVYRL